MAGIDDRGATVDDPAQSRPPRRLEVIGACLLGVALFAIPLVIDLARATA
jgi:hypothetical protein